MLNDKTQITQLCKVTLTQKCSKETDSKALNELCGIRNQQVSNCFEILSYGYKDAHKFNI